MQSDNLPFLRQLNAERRITGERLMQPLLCVVDTNFILQTVRAKARYPSADLRTPLEEAVSAGMLVAFAPFNLDIEVPEKLPRLVSSKVSLEQLQAAWPRIREHIRFQNAPPGIDSEAIRKLRLRDADDVPFARLFEYLQLEVVLSNDSDWDETGYPRFDEAAALELTKHARSYARAASRELTVSTAVNACTAVFKGFKEDPWSMVALLGVGALFLAGPGRQPAVARIRDWLDAPPVPEEKAKHQAELRRHEYFVFDALGRGLGHLYRNPPAKAPLREHAFRVLLRYGPGTLMEVKAHLLRQGYRFSTADWTAELRAAFVSDARVLEEAPDRWSLRPFPTALS
jgi:hypothetical protein